jgi:hypothetical protein
VHLSTAVRFILRTNLFRPNTSVPDPSATNAGEVQRVLFHLERNLLAPYELPANRLSRDMYDSIPLPWDVSPPIISFPQSSFVRNEWDRDGILSNGEDFFGGTEQVSLDKLEAGLSTASMVTRWRAAHPELVGTSEDCATDYRRFEGCTWWGGDPHARSRDCYFTFQEAVVAGPCARPE